MKRWNIDKFLSILAILISVGTLIIFIYQTNLIREHQYASVLPYLSIDNQGISTKNFKLILSNDGIGPAIIKSVEVITDRNSYFMDPAQYILEKKPVEKDSIDFYYSNLIPGMLVPANEHIELIGSQGTLQQANNLMQALEEINIKVEYESIYGSRWLTQYGSYSPKQIK